MVDEIEKKVMEFNMFEMKLNELGQQKELIEKQIVEMKNLQLSLDKLKDVKKQTEIFSMVGQDTFIVSEIKDTQKVLVNVGAKIFVKKDLEDAKETIEHKIVQIDEMNESLNLTAEKILEKMNSLGKEIKDLS
jgi:prefoldin alpha subunit